MKKRRFVVITRERKKKQELRNRGRSSYKCRTIVNTLYNGWLRYLGQHTRVGTRTGQGSVFLSKLFRVVAALNVLALSK